MEKKIDKKDDEEEGKKYEETGKLFPFLKAVEENVV